MKLFLGEYQPNLSEGFRIAMPKKLREQISNDEVVLTRGFEKCILIYEKDYWLQESEKQMSSSITDQKNRELKRYLFAQAHDTKFDSQGRFVVPMNLVEYASLNINQEITVIGAGDHMEIWNSSEWKEYFLQVSLKVLE